MRRHLELIGRVGASCECPVTLCGAHLEMQLNAKQHVEVLIDCQALQDIAEAHGGSQPQSLPCTGGRQLGGGGTQGWEQQSLLP